VGVGLIVIGDELLSGRRRDKHLPHLIEILPTWGLELAWSHWVGDDRQRLAAFLGQSLTGPDWVLACGGIGATPDDVTRQAAADAAGVGLTRHPEAVECLQARFGDALYPHRIRMAELPEGSDLVPNPVNGIPGFRLANHFFLPGFPELAWPMMSWCLDQLTPRGTGEPNAIHALWVHDVPESALIDPLEGLERAFPAVRAFSLPRLGANRPYRVEVGVKGPQSASEAAFEWLQAQLDAAGFGWRLQSDDEPPRSEPADP